MSDRKTLLLAALLVAGCSATDAQPRLDINRASMVIRGTAVELDAAIAFRPSPTQLQALDHGVPLSFRVTVSGDGKLPPARLRLVLRYFPLSRRYQLRVVPGTDRSFALRGYLLDALQRLSLPLTHDPCTGIGSCRVQVQFDYSGLPGALRLPALVRPAWRVPKAQIAVRIDAA